MDHPSYLSSAVWGVAGAFVYAAPRLIACLITCREKGDKPWLCLAEFVVSLIIGAIGAAAFSTVAMGLAHMKDVNAASALTGMLVNPVAPKLIGAAGAIMSSVIESPLAKALKGGEKP